MILVSEKILIQTRLIASRSQVVLIMILVSEKILIQKVRSKTKILQHFCYFRVNDRCGPEKLFKVGIKLRYTG
jgi:hypothetical protein